MPARRRHHSDWGCPHAAIDGLSPFPRTHVMAPYATRGTRDGRNERVYTDESTPTARTSAGWTTRLTYPPPKAGCTWRWCSTWHSRRIVGWSMKPELTAQLVVDALMMALWRRGKPREFRCTTRTRVGRYASAQFQSPLAESGITCSMSEHGDVRDSPAMEGFFSTIKTERLNRIVYRTRDEARLDTFDYIERFCNPRRRLLEHRNAQPCGARGSSSAGLETVPANGGRPVFGEPGAAQSTCRGPVSLVAPGRRSRQAF